MLGQLCLYNYIHSVLKTQNFLNSIPIAAKLIVRVSYLVLTNCG